MEHTYTINGLREHRSQVAGDVEFYRAKALEAAQLLASIDQVLRSLGDEGSDIVAPPRQVQAAGMVRRGELSRLLITALRDAPEGLTVGDLALHVCRERGWATDDARWMNALREKIGRSLAKKKAKGRVTNKRQADGWFWYVVPVVATVEGAERPEAPRLENFEPR